MSELLPFFLKKTDLVRFFTTFCFVSVFSLLGCQERLVLEDKTPFGEGGVRMGDTVVAEIDGTKIYLSDVERTAAAQGLIETGSPLVPGNPVFQSVLDEKIDQRLLALEALKQALDQDDEVRRRLNEARERILSNSVIEKHLAERVNEVTLRRMYEEQASLADRGAERRIRQIVVQTEDEITEIIKRLKAGESFATLAAENSIDLDTKPKGGDMGFVTRDMLDPLIAGKVFSTDIGAITDPVQTAAGWHVLKVDDRRRPPQPQYDVMRDEILNFMTYDEMQKLVRTLRTNGEVKFLYGKGSANQPAAQSLDSDTPPNTSENNKRSEEENEK